MTDTAPRPVVKLRPGKGRRLREGAPWIYADEIAFDRRTKGLAPGTIATLAEPARDGAPRPIGTVALNPESQIAARLLDPDPDARIGRDWLAVRLAQALRMRRAVFGSGLPSPTPSSPETFCRLVHAEGDGLPGLVIDLFGDAAVIQPNAAWIDRLLDDLVGALDVVFEAHSAPPLGTVVVNAQSRVRGLEGLGTHLSVIRGDASEPVEVAMNGARYLADLVGGQKTGLFYDQRDNHAAFAALMAPGVSVLDVFCHVGGFGLAALAAAEGVDVVAVDSSEPALALAVEAARRMGVGERYEARRADAFEAMAAAAEAGESYGAVVCDPPAFAPHKGALEAGLRAYEKTARLAARLVRAPGWLVLCSCSGAVDAEAFRAASARGIRAAGRDAALVRVGRAGADHPQHLSLPETGYLKALTFFVRG